MRESEPVLSRPLRALMLVATLFVSIVAALAPSNVDASALPLAPPTTTSLTPNHGPTDGGTPVTLTGTNFDPDDTRIVVVSTRGSSRTVPANEVTINDTATIATFTMPRITDDGTAGVFALTPAGRSNPQLFTYETPSATRAGIDGGTSQRGR